MTERDYVSLAADYQADVLSGKIAACKWVRLAAERNRRDLDRQGTEDFPFKFDPNEARRICQMAEMLPHIKGPKAFVVGKDAEDRPIWNTIVLEPWQCWLFTTVFGWKKLDGTRRFRVAFPLIPRKNAKSTIAAIVVLFMLVADGESGAECYSAATTRDQAKVIAEIAWEMARRSPAFREFFGVKMGSKTTRTLEVPATASRFGPLSADAGSLDGLNVSLAAIDEFHAHKTRGVYDVLDTATGTRLQPLLFPITTAGVELGGICHEKLQYLEKILDGVVVDETFFGVNYTIDSAPHTDKIESVHAIEELTKLCNSECVPSTQIAQFIHEACARHATTDGTEKQAQRDARRILIERLRQEGCVPPAINDGGLIETHLSKNNSDNAQPYGAGSGRSETEKNVELQTPDTETILRPEKNSERNGDSTLTESPESSTTGCTPSKKGSVPSAIDRRLYTWITATAAALFGDYFARNATAQLVFSETLKSVYNAHSPTCDVRQKSRLLEDGKLAVDRLADDIRDPVIQRKANPNYGVSVQPDDLERKITEAQTNQAALNNVLTKHFNVWIRTESSWMSATTWQTCAKDGLTAESLKAFPLYVGVDLGETRDPSSLALLFKTAPETYALIVRIYMPKDVVAKSPIAQLSGWVREGHVIETPGNEADYSRIRDDLFEIFQAYQVQEIDFDKRAARLMMQDFRKMIEPTLGRDRTERTVLDIPQNVDVMDPAMKTAEALVLATKIQHDGNPAMAWMVSNIVVERDYKGQIYPRKAGGKDSANKIDGAIAFFTALSQAMRAKEPEPSYQFIVVGGR